MLYLDYSATTPIYEEVIETMSNVLRDYYGNPSSLHGIGYQAEQLITKAREILVHYLKCQLSEIVFTSGGTESNNLAIAGVARSYANRGKHLIISRIEHASVYECAHHLEQEGWSITYIDADNTGAVDTDKLMQAVRSDTVLVSLMHVNNETGRIQPVEQVGRLLKAYPKVLFHVDATQSVGKLNVHPAEIGADLLTGSAHKFRGPKGAGFLFIREGVSISPILFGGAQENGLRAGTENVPAIVGMAKALRMTEDRREQDTLRLRELRRSLVGMLSEMPEVVISGVTEPLLMAPHIVHFRLPGFRTEVLLHALEERGVCISTKSACSSGNSGPSRVLLAMGVSESEAKSGMRVSFSPEHSLLQLEQFCRHLRDVMNKWKPMDSDIRGLRR
jgi:cysteine desulfurase